MTTDMIYNCFERCGKSAKRLRETYHIDRRRPRQSKNGALDFLHDARFTLPVEDIADRRRSSHCQVYQYVFDQANPWQSSSGAHHAVDLVSLFGAIDLTFNPASARVAKDFRQRFISFARGQFPWSSQERYAFGPHGKSGVLEAGEYDLRRRTHCTKTLREIGLSDYNLTFAALAAGRLSLLN